MCRCVMNVSAGQVGGTGVWSEWWTSSCLPTVRVYVQSSDERCGRDSQRLLTGPLAGLQSWLCLPAPMWDHGAIKTKVFTVKPVI